ncbi:vascular endothelial growth factor receptor 3-like [Labeo rohita]|uniref:vascular endothelial growth factor receptor 3-like n=1 Tax=Labeo rohita TaxID=84645 RepID=UPI0021E2D185|nr:vascular endothelial growth factor receptor 3-like [Labeo rohita]
MRNHSLLLWVLLVVDGVFGAAKVKSVLVMVSDSLTLNTNDTETQGADELEWRIQGDKTFIAQIDKEHTTISVPGNEEAPFRGRLKLDEKTGSLTITNIKSTDSRVYELKIKSRADIIYNTFSVTVHEKVKSISVMEGDSVTLHTGVTEIQRNDRIKWMFGDKDTPVADFNGPVDGRNIHLNSQTGDLTITNIQTHQSGVYKVELSTSIMNLHRELHIAVDKVESISLMEGYSVTLHTDVEVQRNDQIQWKFGDQGISIANLNGPVDANWRNIHLNRQTGNLTIRNIRSDQSGVYKVEVNTSIVSLHREFSVVVVPGLSLAAVAGIVVAVVLPMAAAAVAGVVYHRHKISKLESRRDANAGEGTGSDVLLKDKPENNSSS